MSSGYKSCESSGPKSCTTWANIQARGDKIATFTVNGKSLRDRLSVGNGMSVPVGALGRVTVESTYQSVQSGFLFAIFRLRAGSHPVEVDQVGSAYITKRGTQVSPAQVQGPSTLLAHALGNYYIAFENSQIGGRLVLKLINTDDFSNASATIPTS